MLRATRLFSLSICSSHTLTSLPLLPRSHFPPLPLLRSRRNVQLRPSFNNLLHLADRFRQLLLLLQESRLRLGPSNPDALQVEFHVFVPVPGVGEHVHIVLHLPAAHFLFLDGLCSHVDRE